jgi:hypothetical protein
MTDNEKELLYIIRNHDDPEKALQIAMNLMVDFLTKLEELRDTSFERPPESA